MAHGLSAVKAVYVIRIGTRANCMWAAHPVTMKVCGRDGPYANLNDPTGGNKEMIELRNKYGAEYITSNFSYSILEIFDKRRPVTRCLAGNPYWKGVLRTIEFGMNDN